MGSKRTTPLHFDREELKAIADRLEEAASNRAYTPRQRSRFVMAMNSVSDAVDFLSAALGTPREEK